MTRPLFPRWLLASAACLLLTACETATTYQAAASPTAVGYSEQRIEPGRYRVTFQGGEGSPQQVQDYALLRAAQITLRDGYDWFRVIERYGDARPPRSGTTVSIGGANFGRHSAVGLGTSFDLSGGPIVNATLEIQMGHGAKPEAADAYDAHGVVAEIGPRAEPPPPHP